MRFERLWAAVQKEIPGARILPRDQSWGLKTLMAPLALLGQNYGFFTTTISRTIYVPTDFESWTDDQKYELLRHEVHHLRQFKYWPLGDLGRWWWINALIVALCYVFIFPVFLTLRAHFEREGYYQNLLVAWELGGLRTPEDQAAEIAWVAEQFAGPAYGWMWNRFSATKWAQQMVDQIVATAPVDPDNVGHWVDETTTQRRDLQARPPTG